MIESIDHASLCGHLKATLSGVVPNDILQGWIGRLNNLPINSFEQIAKDLAIVFTNAVQGKFLIPPDEIPHLGIIGNTERRDRNGDPVPGNLYRDNVLNIILSSDFSESTDKMYAGLTNLKSACVIKTLSRAEKDDAYSSIAHKTDIDETFLAEWREFVSEFTPYLIKRLGSRIENVTEYRPIWMSPSSETGTSYLDSRGHLHAAKKGDLRSITVNNLKHPEINRIARTYPDEFASAVLVGFDVLGAEFDLPEPFDRPCPVGRVAIAPKRAQKARIVFVPLAFLDCMSRPAFSKLTQLYAWNVQGVESHDNSRRLVQRLLVDNPDLEEVWSFDQSSFTDNFDYNQIQRPILLALRKESVLTDYDIDVVDILNNGAWDANTLRPNKFVTFGCGTGMGTPPSFPLASIGNGYLYAYAYWKVHGSYPDPNPQRTAEAVIVGDDLCIRGTAVAQQYISVCERIGLKINKSKSMHSDQVAEFCGKIITSNGIFDKKKLIDVTSYAALADQIDYYQERMEEYLESFPEFIPLVERLRQVPRPFGVGEPIDLLEHVPIESMTTEQTVTLLQQQASDLIQKVREDKIPSPPEWKTAMVRKDNLPSVQYELDVSTPKYHRPKPPLKGINLAMAENAIDIYQHASLSSLESLQQAARTIDGIYHLIVSQVGIEGLLPDNSESTVTLAKRHKSKDVASRLAKILEATEKIESPVSDEKGGMAYE